MCFEFDALPPVVPADRVWPQLAGGAAAEILTLTSSDGTEFGAACAECPADDASGTGVIILPDVRGLYQFYITLAERFVTAGHHAITFDYFGRMAGVEIRGEDFDYMAELPSLTPELVQQDIAAARAELVERTGVSSVVTMGFCYGGAQSFLAGTNESLGLDAVIGFYGTLDGPGRIGADFMPAPLKHAEETKVPVLGLFGGADDFIPAEDITAYGEALDRAGVPHDLITYDGAPHSFFDRSFEEHAEASADAWRRVLDFLGRVGAKAAA